MPCPFGSYVLVWEHENKENHLRSEINDNQKTPAGHKGAEWIGGES